VEKVEETILHSCSGGPSILTFKFYLPFIIILMIAAFIAFYFI